MSDQQTIFDDEVWVKCLTCEQVIKTEEEYQNHFGIYFKDHYKGDREFSYKLRCKECKQYFLLIYSHGMCSNCYHYKFFEVKVDDKEFIVNKGDLIDFLKSNNLEKPK